MNDESIITWEKKEIRAIVTLVTNLITKYLGQSALHNYIRPCRLDSSYWWLVIACDVKMFFHFNVYLQLTLLHFYDGVIGIDVAAKMKQLRV